MGSRPRRSSAKRTPPPDFHISTSRLPLSPILCRVLLSAKRARRSRRGRPRRRRHRLSQPARAPQARTRYNSRRVRRVTRVRRYQTPHAAHDSCLLPTRARPAAALASTDPPTQTPRALTSSPTTPLAPSRLPALSRRVLPLGKALAHSRRGRRPRLPTSQAPRCAARGARRRRQRQRAPTTAGCVSCKPQSPCTRPTSTHVELRRPSNSRRNRPHTQAGS